MKTLFKKMNSLKGFGTIEVVIIIAVLISIALIFRTSITSYATNLMDTVFKDHGILN